MIEALDRLSDQIAAEVFDSLLCAATVEQLAKSLRLFPRFRDYYVSTLLILLGLVQEDTQRFSTLTIRSFEESENIIRSNDPHWIGQDASLNALQGLASITRVAKAATRLFDPNESTDVRADASATESWGSSIAGFAMEFSAVFAALTVLSNGHKTAVRLENAAALAHWSKRWALQEHHLTKGLGSLRLAPTAHAGIRPEAIRKTERWPNPGSKITSKPRRRRSAMTAASHGESYPSIGSVGFPGGILKIQPIPSASQAAQPRRSRTRLRQFAKMAGSAL